MPQSTSITNHKQRITILSHNPLPCSTVTILQSTAHGSTRSRTSTSTKKADGLSNGLRELGDVVCRWWRLQREPPIRAPYGISTAFVCCTDWCYTGAVEDSRTSSYGYHDRLNAPLSVQAANKLEDHRFVVVVQPYIGTVAGCASHAFEPTLLPINQ